MIRHSADTGIPSLQ